MKTVYEVWYVTAKGENKVYMDTHHLGYAAKMIEEMTQEGQRVWLQITSV